VSPSVLYRVPIAILLPLFKITTLLESLLTNAFVINILLLNCAEPLIFNVFPPLEFNPAPAIR
jgi:hypothetical protein